MLIWVMVGLALSFCLSHLAPNSFSREKLKVILRMSRDFVVDGLSLYDFWPFSDRVIKIGREGVNAPARMSVCGSRSLKIRVVSSKYQPPLEIRMSKGIILVSPTLGLKEELSPFPIQYEPPTPPELFVLTLPNCSDIEIRRYRPDASDRIRYVSVVQFRRRGATDTFDEVMV